MGSGPLGSCIEGEDIMKLANLFLITALVGVLGAIGCSTDSGNGNGGAGGDGGSVGNGGNGGGGGMAACTGGECASDDARKASCEAAIAYCNSLGAGGGGGAGGAPTEAQCDALGNKICDIETGTGGAGGDGGTGGTPGGCDWTAEELCAECDNASASADCESFFGNCLENPPSGGEDCDKCAFLALSECGI